MHHVTCIRDAPKRAVCKLIMKARRLSLCAHNAVLLARDDDDRHFELCVFSAQSKGVWDHESGLGSTRTDLGWAKSHLLREALKLGRHLRRPKYLSHQEWPEKPAEKWRESVSQDVADDRDRRSGQQKHVGAGVAQNKASNTARGTPESWRTCGYEHPSGAFRKASLCFGAARCQSPRVRRGSGVPRALLSAWARFSQASDAETRRENAGASLCPPLQNSPL
jgi:hypothetical protein